MENQRVYLSKKLLENAYFLLKKGGNIVYSTCTLNKKENEKQIEKFMTKYPDMKKRKELTILPYQYHSDGFYMCLLEKEWKYEINLWLYTRTDDWRI